ncbi:MAG: O-antigen ligase family protein [Pyrinomonadaceae bacterium]
MDASLTFRDEIIAESSSVKIEPVPMALSFLVALTPLVFSVQLFEPYIAAKEIFVQAGTATVGLLWVFTKRASFSMPAFTPIWVPLLVFAAIGSASILWSVNPAISFAEVQCLATYGLLFVIALDVMRLADARTAILTTLILAGGIEAIYVLVQYFVGDPLFAANSLPGKWQTFGTMGNPNWTGEFLAVAALVALGRLIELRRNALQGLLAGPFANQFTLLALILMVLGLAATLARGAWLAFIIGTLAFLIARGYGTAARSGWCSFTLPRAVAGAALIAVIAVPLWFNQQAINHLFNLKSINGRVLMSVVSWEMIRDAPLTGYGLGTFGLRFPEYQAEVLSQPWAERFIPNASFTTYAHNDYLQIWTEIGVFGLIAFAALIWIVLRRGRALAGNPVELGCWAGVISILVNAAVAFPIHLPTTLMLLVVLIAAVEAAARKKSVRIALVAVPRRITIALVTIVLCVSAFWISYDRVVADTALWRADAALVKNQFDYAEPEIRTAIEHSPIEQVGRLMFGRLLVERGEYAEALTVLNQAQKFGFDVETYDLKATVYAALGQQDNAVESMNELIRLRPDLLWPRDRLAALNLRADGNKENIR